MIGTFIKNIDNLYECKILIVVNVLRTDVYSGDVAQMVERSLSMREVRGSIPCISTPLQLKILSRHKGPIYTHKL